MKEAIGFQDASDSSCSVDPHGGELAHQKETQNMVEIGAGKDDAIDGRIAQSLR